MTTKSISILALLASLFMASGCDWEQFALLNSIPFDGSDDNGVMHVYLGVDGLSYPILQEAQSHGYFSGSDWHSAKLISMFPGTSDSSWGRLLRTPRIGGYEYEYYDPKSDELLHTGYAGLLAHAVPPLDWSVLDRASYIEAFDYFGNGYLDVYWKYTATKQSLGESLDNFFYLLGGRAKTSNAFTGYFLELDVLGHMQTRGDVLRSLESLAKNIEAFKRRHSERRFVFTIFSDHGMDFIPARVNELLSFDEEMKRFDINAVKTFAEGRKKGGLFAVPVIHTRVSYLGMHTEVSMVQDVALRSSQSEGIDFALAKTTAPIEATWAGVNLQWFGVWRGGALLFKFAFDPDQDEYLLPSLYSYDALGFDVQFDTGESHQIFTDEDAFALANQSDYPDFFFRVRSAFAPISIEFPADVLLSFKRPYASIGFQIPGGANAIANSGFHGAMDALGSTGVLLTEERTLPPVIRSDNLLQFFPVLHKHLLERDIDLRQDDADLDLQYEGF